MTKKDYHYYQRWYEKQEAKRKAKADIKYGGYIVPEIVAKDLLSRSVYTMDNIILTGMFKSGDSTWEATVKEKPNLPGVTWDDE
jgi:hypothetical protein